MTGVSVIGDAPDDIAISVFLMEQDEDYWFNPELVELLDVGAGATMTVGSKSFVKTETGEWEEIGGEQQPSPPRVFVRAFRSLFGR